VPLDAAPCSAFSLHTDRQMDGRTERENYDPQHRAVIAASPGKNHHNWRKRFIFTLRGPIYFRPPVRQLLHWPLVCPYIKNRRSDDRRPDRYRTQYSILRTGRLHYCRALYIYDCHPVLVAWTLSPERINDDVCRIQYTHCNDPSWIRTSAGDVL